MILGSVGEGYDVDDVGPAEVSVRDRSENIYAEEEGHCVGEVYNDSPPRIIPPRHSIPPQSRPRTSSIDIKPHRSQYVIIQYGILHTKPSSAPGVEDYFLE